MQRSVTGLQADSNFHQLFRYFLLDHLEDEPNLRLPAQLTEHELRGKLPIESWDISNLTFPFQALTSRGSCRLRPKNQPMRRLRGRVIAVVANTAKDSPGFYFHVL
jgi:hypothetical protein